MMLVACAEVVSAHARVKQIAADLNFLTFFIPVEFWEKRYLLKVTSLLPLGTIGAAERLDPPSLTTGARRSSESFREKGEAATSSFAPRLSRPTVGSAEDA